MRYTPFQKNVLNRFAFVAFCFLLTTQAQAQFSYAEQFFEKGLAAAQENDLQDAVDSYTLTLQENPNFSEALFHRSQAYFKMGKMTRAMYDLDDLLHNNPYDVRAIEFRGQIRYDMQNYEAALIDFQSVLGLHRSPEGYLNVGLVLNEMGKTTEAISAFNNALKMNPTYGEAFCGIADTYAAQGELYYNKAFEYYSIALRHNSEDVFALRNRGKLHLRMGNYDNAINDFNQSLDYVLDFEAYLHLAQCFLEKNEWTKAHRAIRDAMEIENDHPEVYFTLGLVEMETGKYNAALESFWVAKGYDTNNPEYLRQIGLAEYHLGNPYGAVRAFNDYTDKVGEDAEIEMLVAKCYDSIEATNAEIQASEAAKEEIIYAAPAIGTGGSNEFSEDMFDKE